MHESAKQADIGALLYKHKGYDKNAWFFEGANAAKIAAKFSISKPWGIYSTIKGIARYF